MSVSPVRFLTDFERLKGQLENAHSAERRLRLLLDFWPVIQGVRSNQTFAGFVQEYVGLVANTLTKNALSDATARQLEPLEAQISAICDAGLDSAKLRLVRERKAWALLYLGETEAGISALAASREEADSEDVVQTIPDQLSEIERLQFVHDNIGQGALKDGLKAILSEWQLEREAVFHDRAICVFVEKGNENGNSQGKIRTLRGRVEPGSRSAPNDEVTFDNQIRTPQDPFVGSAYTALEAVRSYFAATGNARLAKSRFHAHLNIEDSGETFTGDSIGLAMALLAFTQLLQPEAARHDRFLSAEVAYTGAVAEDGRVLPVSQESIGAKVERAFHSQVRFLVLPQANYTAARSRLDHLESQYPHRSLSLIPVRHLTDCLKDHNIVRSEKVCIGEFVARKAVKYSRMTKVQVPLLVVLGYLLLAAISPKTFWPWFEWKIDRIQVNEFDFSALKADGTVLWRSQKFDQALHNTSTFESRGIQQNHAIVDFDGDGRDEVCFVPNTRESSDLNSKVLFYDYRGELIDSVKAFVITQYPGDVATSTNSINLSYAVNWILPVRYDAERTALLTISQASNPARQQVSVFDQNGKLLSGPFLNTGFSIFTPALIDIDDNGDDEVVVYGMNNRSDMACIAMLEPSNLSGVSPPYDDERFLQLHESRGSQLWFVELPGTRFSEGSEARPAVSLFEAIGKPPSGYRATVRDGCGRTVEGNLIRCNVDSDPHITYFVEFDSLFRYLHVNLGDNQLERLNYNLTADGQSPYFSRAEVEAELAAGIRVYRGNQLVPDSITHSRNYR